MQPQTPARQTSQGCTAPAQATAAPGQQPSLNIILSNLKEHAANVQSQGPPAADVVGPGLGGAEAGDATVAGDQQVEGTQERSNLHNTAVDATDDAINVEDGLLDPPA